ncbi:MAG: DciA family protein [Planctomycetota bacterium]
MRKRRYIEPSPLKEVLPGVLRGLKPSKASPVGRVRAVWDEVVGPEAASRTHVASLESGILQVQVSSAALKHHLSTFQAEEVLRRLRERLGGPVVRSVRYRVGSLS